MRILSRTPYCHLFPSRCCAPRQLMASVELFCDPVSSEGDADKKSNEIARMDDADRYCDRRMAQDFSHSRINKCVFVCPQESSSSETGRPFFIDAQRYRYSVGGDARGTRWVLILPTFFPRAWCTHTHTHTFTCTHAHSTGSAILLQNETARRSKTCVRSTPSIVEHWTP